MNRKYTSINRRRFIVATGGAVLAMGASLAPAMAVTRVAAARRDGMLRLTNTHTGERFSGIYRKSGVYVPQAITQLKALLRDHRANESHDMDETLFDWLDDLANRLGGGQFQVISGYRSPATNAKMHKKSNGVAKRSMHMQGRAIDVRLDGVATNRLRDLALADARGGVGFYGKSDFVHLDTGRVRHW